MTQEKFMADVDSLLKELLAPRNRAILEMYRFRGSTNRVYRIPMGTPDGDFIVVKLLPRRWVEVKNRFKRFLRNIAYGEHIVSTGMNRAQMEIERVREWQSEGLKVPPLIETTLPGVRVFKGLHYPTFYTILTDKAYPLSVRLNALAVITRSLSHQHMLAFQKGRKGLVHKDPGPWNVMFDVSGQVAYWFDLEQPADHPQMSVEALIVRGLRIFLFGVLDQMEAHMKTVVEIVEENYQMKDMLDRLARQLDQKGRSRALAFGQTLNRRRMHRSMGRLAELIWQSLENIGVRLDTPNANGSKNSEEEKAASHLKQVGESH